VTLIPVWTVARRVGVLALLGVAALMLASAPAGASAASRAKAKIRYDLAMRSAQSGTGTYAPNERLALTTTVENMAKRRSPTATLMVILFDHAGQQGLDFEVGPRVRALTPHQSLTTRFIMHFSARLKPGRDLLVLCVTSMNPRATDTNDDNDCVLRYVTIAKPAVTATLQDPVAPSATRGSATIVVHANDATTLSCTLDGVARACTQNMNVLTSLADGSHHFVAVARDPWGNAATSVVTWTSDATGPAGGSLSYANGSFTLLAQPQVTFTAASDAHGPVTWQLQRATAAYDTGSSTCAATYSAFASVGGANPTSPFTDSGVPANTCVMYQLVSTDAFGNSTAASSSNVYVVLP
jgi:hypothetical protein